MAIAFRAAGTWIDSALTAITPTIPAGTVAGDLMLAMVGGKPFNSTVTINQGWNDGGSATDGTTAAGNDTGSMQTKIFWKVHTGTESNPTVSFTSGNVFSGVIISFSKDANASWDVAFGGGGDNTAGTGFSATTPFISLATNDVIASVITTRSDAGTIGTFTVSSTLNTIGAFTSAPTAGYTTITGGDMSARSGYNTVSIGLNVPQTITVASTLGAAHTGSMYLVRIREVFPTLNPMGTMGFFGF